MNLFHSPHYLALMLLSLGACSLLLWWSEKRHKKLLSLFAEPNIMKRLFPQQAIKNRKTKFFLRSITLMLLLGALAGPQWGIELVTTHAKITQVVVAIDTSLSMLAEDLKPNRMKAAKNTLTFIIDELQTARIGIIAFAGEAFIQCPLTTDIDAVKSLLTRIQTGMIPQPGTAIGKAIELGTSMLRKHAGHKAMVLLTDGEDHGSQPLEAARRAYKNGVHLFIIGVGTPEGEPIPLKDKSGNIIAYKKDSNDKTILSRLGESSLIQLAAASKGAYYRASPTQNEVGFILQQIKQMGKSDLKTNISNRYKNRYRLPLFIAFIILIFEMLLPENRRESKKTHQSALAALMLIFSLSFTNQAAAAPSEFEIWKGNKSYNLKNYSDALKLYQKTDSKNTKAKFNSGAALYKLGEFSGAQKTYSELLKDLQEKEKRGDPKIAAKAFYNLGNALYQQEKIPQAAQAYKQCLILNPSDEDCRHNFIVTIKPPQKKKQKKENKKNKNKDNKKPKQPPPGQQRPQPQNQGLSKDDAQRILSAVKQAEKSAQKKQQGKQNLNQLRNTFKGIDW